MVPVFCFLPCFVKILRFAQNDNYKYIILANHPPLC
jgi:hypothetical protein